MALPIAKTTGLHLALAGSVALHAGVLLAMREPPSDAATLAPVAPQAIELSVPDDEPAVLSQAAGVPAATRPAPGNPAPASPSPRPSRHQVVPAAAAAQPDDAPPSLASSPAPRFVLAVGAVTPGPASSAAPGTGGAVLEAPVYGQDAVDVPPRFLAWSPPRYPAAAASAGVEVDVPVDVVIDVEGAVADVRLPRHFGYGLDEAAAAAARSYRFSRALRGGRPVRVRMRCTVAFRLN